MGLALMGTIYLMSFREQLPRDPATSLRAIAQAVRKAFPPLLTPVILIGGIVTGVFTPTEAAAVAAVYAFLLSYFFYRTVRLRDIPAIVVDTLVTTAVVTFIISTTSGISWLLIVGKHAERLVEALALFTQSPWLLLLWVNGALFLLGCVMEAGVLLILLTPLLVPLMQAAGVDLVHFGVIMVLNLMIGTATPPVGMGLFVVSEACGIRPERLMREVLPQILPLLLVLLLATYVPWLVLAVPAWLMPTP
jgi:tripartite ATP-independent transporter DctM subunit